MQAEAFTGAGQEPALGQAHESVGEHSPWTAAVGTTKKGFQREWLPKAAKESHIINMIIIKQFT